jgi:hypothetical protein
LINTYLRGLDRCIGLVVIALMHYTSETCVHSRLVSTALKTVSKHVRVLLVSLVCRSNHMLWLSSIRLCQLLSSINILILTLYILEVDRVLRRIDELRMTADLVSSVCTSTSTG